MEDVIREKEPLTWGKGIRDGLPICLGYLSVSFAFGMMATQGGMSPWVALLISMSNLTSAGQVAGTALILSGGLYLEIAVTTFVINIRYMLMSLSLSQKIDGAMGTLQRLALSFGVTDEIFAVSMQQKGELGARYLSGLMLTPYLGWSAGTLLGATATGLLPAAVRTALNIAIYGMFLAIIVPPARHSRPVALVIAIAVAMSCLFRWTPGLNRVSTGWVIILCAVAASAFAALRYPVHETEAQA
ncbi:MAG: AzlC family ABC transporter permease [Clostridiales bacterium]|jgi:predicted branched-subunit amino acid permease|nr:AzlC family ABC transporter permease [Clostridiales bacterium]